MEHRPSWQLPHGVSKGTWDYLQSPSIASDYDAFHAGHPLLKIDCDWISEVIADYQTKFAVDSPTVIDLGCGTGRAMQRCVNLGCKVIGVDLSRQMLEEAAAKDFADMSLDKRAISRPAFLHANLARLDCIAPQSIDIAICLYSSLGMIRGRGHRRKLIENVAMSLKLNGRFLVHVHNRGIWFREPQGIKRIIRERLRTMRDEQWEYGDRIFPYRGLPSMYLHIFSRGEIFSDFRAAGLRVTDCKSLNITSSGMTSNPWFLNYFRSGGYLIAAEK